jgi:hypothetical protein
MTIGLRKALALLTVPVAMSCAPADVCQEIAACGGDVVGTTDADGDGVYQARWLIGGTCMNEVFSPPLNASLIEQPPPIQGQPPPEPTHANWCSEMVLTKDKEVGKLNPWFPSIPLQSGAISYASDGVFSIGLQYFAQQLVEYPENCFESQGFTVVPEGTATSSSTLTCSEFNASLAMRLATEPNISGVYCGEDGVGGCECVYDLLMVTSVNGTFTIDGNVINHYDKVTNEPVTRADYCVNGDQLELGGHHRTFLFSQPHVRNLTFFRE